MELGALLPVSGRAAGPDALSDAARQAERLGFDAIWSAERVMVPRWPERAEQIERFAVEVLPALRG